MTAGITIDALVAELRKCEIPEGTGMTTDEICETANLSPNTVRKMIKKGMAEGRIENFQERRVMAMRGGRVYWANVFRVKE